MPWSEVNPISLSVGTNPPEPPYIFIGSSDDPDFPPELAACGYNQAILWYSNREGQAYDNAHFMATKLVGAADLPADLIGEVAAGWIVRDAIVGGNKVWYSYREQFDTNGYITRYVNPNTCPDDFPNSTLVNNKGMLFEFENTVVDFFSSTGNGYPVIMDPNCYFEYYNLVDPNKLAFMLTDTPIKRSTANLGLSTVDQNVPGATYNGNRMRPGWTRIYAVCDVFMSVAAAAQTILTIYYNGVGIENAIVMQRLAADRISLTIEAEVFEGTTGAFTATLAARKDIAGGTVTILTGITKMTVQVYE